MKELTTPRVNPLPPLPRQPNARPIDTATLELLARWKAQDATDDPEELRAAEQELAAFKKSMNENRTRAGAPPLYP